MIASDYGNSAILATVTSCGNLVYRIDHTQVVTRDHAQEVARRWVDVGSDLGVLIDIAQCAFAQHEIVVVPGDLAVRATLSDGRILIAGWIKTSFLPS